jgi:hypothetical protein
MDAVQAGKSLTKRSRRTSPNPRCVWPTIGPGKPVPRTNCLVSEVSKTDCGRFEILVRLLQIGTIGESRADSGLCVDGTHFKHRHRNGHDLQGPEVRRGRIVYESAQRIFGRSDLRFAHDDGLLALRHFRFDFDDVDWCGRADLDARAGVPERFEREIQRLPVHLEGRDGVRQVPIGVLDRARRLCDRLSQRHIGDLPIFLADEELLARGIDGKAPKQRLAVAERQRRPELWRKIRENVRGRRSRAVPSHAVRTAPGKGLTHADVRVHASVARFWPLRTRKEAVAGCVGAGALQGRRERGKPGGAGSCHVQVVNGRIDSRHLYSEIVFERGLHGLVDGEAPDAGGLTRQRWRLSRDNRRETEDKE